MNIVSKDIISVTEFIYDSIKYANRPNMPDEYQKTPTANNLLAISRLCEVLADLGVLTAEKIMFIATGIDTPAKLVPTTETKRCRHCLNITSVTHSTACTFCGSQHFDIV